MPCSPEVEHDTFGHVPATTADRGRYFLFYSSAHVAGGAVLIALVSGDAAYAVEEGTDEEAVRGVMDVLRSI